MRDSTQSGGSGGKLAALSIRNPVTVCMAFVSLATLGLIAVTRIPLMLMPRLDAPVLFVVAEYFNATPDEVLESITKPLEEAIATVPGVQRMNSRSSAQGTWIQLWCGMGVDTSMLRASIREKIDQIRDDLPEDLRMIDIRNFTTDEIPILEGTLSADRDLRTGYDFLDTRVKKPLERIPGVGNVELWGTERMQLDIYLRLSDIKRYGVDAGRLLRAIDGSNLNLALGPISDGGSRYSAVAKGALQSIEEIRQLPIGQRNLVLSDVADVALDQRPRNSGRHHNGSYAVGLAVQKSADANTVETVNRVQALFEQWSRDPAMRGLAVQWWHDAGKEIRLGLGELLKAGLIGSLLAVAVLFGFLRRLDASLAVGLAIPFSVLAAVGFLYFQGSTLNALTMMGLMLAAGMLVDNAVVVLESIFQKLERGAEPGAAARAGAGEVTVAVIAATSTTMIIFVPLMFDSKSQLAIMLSRVGISIIFALLCSLFVSLTLIPLVAAKFLKRDAGARARFDRRLWRAVSAPVRYVQARWPKRRTGRAARPPLVARYLGLVRWHLDRPYLMGLLVVPAVLALACWTLVEVVPDNSPDANAVSSLRIGYEFSENYHYAKIEEDFVNPVERFLHANQDAFRIKSTFSNYGNNSAWTRAYLDQETLVPDELPGIRQAINAGLPVIPGARIQLNQDGGADKNWISANLYGDSPSVLQELAREARQRLLRRDGIAEVYTDLSGAREEMRVRLRRDLARKYGISPRTVAQVLGITVRSRRIRGFRTPEGEVEVWLGIDPADMQSVEDLKSVVVGAGPGGEQIQLGHVADLQLGRVPGRIARENRRTFAEIEIVYRGERVEDGRKTVAEVLDGMAYEPGYGWTYGFWTNQQNEDAADFLFSMVLALVMVYFVMAALFESVLHPFAIMLSLPFAVVGITLFLLVTGTPFNVMAQIGIIILIGIVVNNGIVLINHVNHLRREGLPRRRAILRGCEERLRPICMTALTTIMGLVPLAWGDGGLLGMDYFPLARTVMGGLMASTALTLVVLPTYYVVLDDLGRWFRQLWMSSSPAVASQPASGD